MFDRAKKVLGIFKQNLSNGIGCMEGPRASLGLQKAIQIISKPTWALLILLIIGALVRISTYLVSTGILWPDSLLYIKSARFMLKLHSMSPHRIYHTPLYPLFLASVFSFGQTTFVGSIIILIQHALGLGIVVLTYFTAKKLFSPIVAFASALLIAIHPTLIYYETVVQTEVLFFFIFAVLLWTAINNKRVSVSHIMALSSLCALLTLARPVSQLFIFPLALYIFLKDNEHSWKRIAKPFLAIAICYMALTPWMFVNYQKFGFFGVSRGQGLNLFFRAHYVDKLRAKRDTHDPHLKKLYKKQNPLAHSPHIALYSKIKRTFNLTDLETDQRMLSFAVETISVHPFLFIGNSISEYFRFFAAPRDSVQICSKEEMRYLCAQRGKRLSVSAFPNVPAQQFSLLRRAVILFFSKWHLPLGAFFILAIAGAGISWVVTNSRPDIVLMVLSLLYFPGMAALFNINEDRYRLPIDSIVVMLACFAIGSLLKVLSQKLRGNRSLSV